MAAGSWLGAGRRGPPFMVKQYSPLPPLTSLSLSLQVSPNAASATDVRFRAVSRTMESKNLDETGPHCSSPEHTLDSG